MHVLLAVGGVFLFLQVEQAAADLQWAVGRRAAVAEVLVLAWAVQAAGGQRAQAREVA